MSTKVVGGGFNPYIGSDAISAARTLSQGGVSGSYGETVLSVTGTLIAEQFKTALASASIIFPSGSTRFGNDDTNDTHHFRGSIFSVTSSVVTFGSPSVQFSSEFPPGAHKADGTTDNLWGSDVTFFVSGAIGGKRTTAAGVGATGGGGVALFGGDLVTSGTLFARDVTLWSGETRSFVITSSAGDAYISSSVSNKDMIFMVNDGGTMTEVFRLDGDVSALKVAANKKLMLGAAEEYLYGDGTDIHISLGAGGDINVPTDIGITFGNDGEKIEGDGTDLTIASSGELNLSVTGDIVIGHQTTKVEWGGAGSGEHIVGAGTNELTIAAGADINLTAASGDVNIPSNIGLTFGNDGEKIEGNGTKLDIAAAELDLSIEAGGDINIPANIGLTFGDDGEKIEGDGTNLTITGGSIYLDAEGDIFLDARTRAIFFENDGTEVGSLHLTGTTNMTLSSKGILTFNSDDGDYVIQKNGTAYGYISQHPTTSDFILSASITDKSVDIYASVSGSSKQYAQFGKEQVLILSGWNSGPTSPDPKEFTDTNFFVSGTIGGKDSDQRGVSGGGVAVFGGDVVASGTLYVDVPITRPAAAFGKLDGVTVVGEDATIFVSGSIGSRGGSSRGTAIFGGDLVVSGVLDVKQQTVTLTNNVSSATVVSGTLGAIQFDYLKTYHAQIRYGIKRNRDVEGGQILMSMAPNGSSADVTVITNIVSVDAQNPGVTFSADVSGGYARLKYTCVNSGSHHATMNYTIEQEFTY